MVVMDFGVGGRERESVPNEGKKRRERFDLGEKKEKNVSVSPISPI